MAKRSLLSRCLSYFNYSIEWRWN